MATLLEDLTDIEEKAQGLVENKVANFAYTQEAYDNDDVEGVSEYDVNKAQNIPTADAETLDVNPTVLNKGYRSQASSITRMLMNHFLGRTSYNLNKSVDLFKKGFLSIKNAIGKPNGIATLDSKGRIPDSQLPESAIEYKGQWNAKTNTPTLADGTGTKGDFYIVSVAGTQNLGSGNIKFLENDRVIYDGLVWSRLSAGDVRTVNNISPVNGNIVLTGENIRVSMKDTTLLSKFKLKDIFSHLLGRFWTQSNITSGTYNTVTYANGIWVAGRSGGLFYSTNGTTWTRSNITSGTFKTVTYANGIWVAGSGSGSGLYYSTKGTTWTQSNITSGNYNTVTYANGIWVAGSGSSGLYYSTNGTTWTQSNITSEYFATVTYANGIWVAGSGSGSGLFYSTNGTTWTRSNITSGTFKTVTYANGIWVAGSGSGLYYATNGTTWTQSNITSVTYNTVTYANGIWVAGSGSSGLYYSTNGTTWTQSNITSGNYKTVTYANGIWVAGSGSGLYYSTNGTTWTQSNITSGNYNTVTYANGIWLVAGSGLYYSDIDTLIKNGWLVLSE